MRRNDGRWNKELTVGRGSATIVQFAVAAMAFAVLTQAALAQQLHATPSRPRAKAATSKQTQKSKPVAQPRAATPCTEFGSGFVRMPGSSTCVRVG